MSGDNVKVSCKDIRRASSESLINAYKIAKKKTDKYSFYFSRKSAEIEGMKMLSEKCSPADYNKIDKSLELFLAWSETTEAIRNEMNKRGIFYYNYN